MDYANTEGGDIYVGIEKDGTILGISDNGNDPIVVKTHVLNGTVPPILTKTELIIQEDKTILHIEVPVSSSIVATSNGKSLKRRIKIDGSSENVPFYPFEMTSRFLDLNKLDYSAQVIPDATMDDLNPNERIRLRQLIRLNNGEKNLLDLDDYELDKALGLVKEIDGRLRPTVTGMLLLGKEDRFKELVPTAKTSFQVSDDSELPGIEIPGFYGRSAP